MFCYSYSKSPFQHYAREDCLGTLEIQKFIKEEFCKIYRRNQTQQQTQRSFLENNITDMTQRMDSHMSLADNTNISTVNAVVPE